MMQYDLRPMFLKQQEKQQQVVVLLVCQIGWAPESKQYTSKDTPEIFSIYILIHLAHSFKRILANSKSSWR